MSVFLLSLLGRFAAAVVLAWLALFVFLYLLPNAGGDPLALQLFGDRLGVTLPLVLMAGILALLIGVGISLLAIRLGGLGDYLLGGFAALLSYLPPLWLGLILALVLSTGLGLLPNGGFVPWSSGLGGALGSLILPALALGLPHAGQFAIRLRAALGPEPAERAIRQLRMAGRSEAQAHWDLRLGQMLPQLPQLVGRLLASLLIGAAVVENVFYLPGLGRQVLGAALAHDLPGLRAGLFLLVVLAGLAMLLASLGRLAFDPALRAAA
jgi:peptide/nickel transport system permease protein